ncbi:hypothetical protein D047_0233A, partial [Vibrio parahaemolyticus VPTS-2010_2]
MNRTRYPV